MIKTMPSGCLLGTIMFVLKRNPRRGCWFSFLGLKDLCTVAGIRDHQEDDCRQKPTHGRVKCSPVVLHLDLQYPWSFIYLFLYLRRERERESRAGADKRRQNLKQALSSKLLAQSPTRDSNSTGLKLTSREIMAWAEVRHLTDWATQAPHPWSFCKER